MTGEQIFLTLWKQTHGEGWINIPLKADTIKQLLEWMAVNMKKSLLTKLGLNDISTLSVDEIEEKIELDQVKRTKERKKSQVKYGNKGSKKRKQESSV